MQDRLNIAVAGAGLIGVRHIEILHARPDARLSAIVDPSPQAQTIADRYGVPRYNDLNALFATDKPDGIILATPNALHVPQALQCLEAGVPMLLEKPAADTLTAGQRLLDAEAQHPGVAILVGHHRTHSPIMTRAREVAESGVLGRLVAVTGSAMFYKPDDYFDAAPWRRQAGGGPILINLIHEIHNLRLLCGEITAVQAIASSATRGFPVEDTVAINLRFASNALGSFMLSDTAASAMSWEQTSQENKSYASYPDEDCYQLIGTDGSLAVPTMRLKTYPGKADRSWWKPFNTETITLERSDPLENQMAHFIDVIHGRAKPLVSLYDGLQNLRITEAISEATRTGGTVSTTGATASA